MEKTLDGQDGATHDVEFSIRFPTFHRSLKHLYISFYIHSSTTALRQTLKSFFSETKNPDGYLYIVPRRRLASLQSDLLMQLIIHEIFHNELEIIAPLRMLNNSRSDQRVSHSGLLSSTYCVT